MPETDDLTLLTEAAHEAGAIAKRHFRRGAKVWQKPDSAGPVTEADLEINEMLADRLTGARPEYGWLSEESPDNDERLRARTTFIIDPLDGTRAFIEGDAAWAHSLAVVENGAPVAAVVYLPMSDMTFAAQRGAGAWLNGERIGVSPREILDGATVLASRPNFEPWHWADADVPDVRRQFRSSLAYRLGLVAEGRYDAMLTLRPTWEWDVAAGTLIVAEAGGRVSDRRGAVLRFNNALPQFDGVIAGAPRVQQEIIRRLF